MYKQSLDKICCKLFDNSINNSLNTIDDKNVDIDSQLLHSITNNFCNNTCKQKFIECINNLNNIDDVNKKYLVYNTLTSYYNNGYNQSKEDNKNNVDNNNNNSK